MKKPLIVFAAFVVVLVLTMLFIFWTCQLYNFTMSKDGVFGVSFGMAFATAFLLTAYFDVTKN